MISRFNETLEILSGDNFFAIYFIVGLASQSTENGIDITLWRTVHVSGVIFNGNKLNKALIN
jgi:hypothetical protein